MIGIGKEYEAVQCDFCRKFYTYLHWCLTELDEPEDQVALCDRCLEKYRGLVEDVVAPVVCLRE